MVCIGQNITSYREIVQVKETERQSSLAPMPTITTSLATSSLSSATNNSNVINSPSKQTNHASFDPHDENSWFFGFMSRADAADLLSRNDELGAFLVRESTTARGDLVLSVKENNDKISHYIINRITPDKGNQVRFKIGDQVFSDIPALLSFYKSNNLDDTPLRFPAIPRTKGSLTNRRSFTKDYLAETQTDLRLAKATNGDLSSSLDLKVPPTFKRKLPSRAMVIQSRIPNAYDKTALTLKEGQIIRVTKIDISGCWEGEIDGRIGHFPFNCVKFIEEVNDTPPKTI